jgi:hypothetical protein
MNTTTGHTSLGRNVICVLAACLLTVVLLGGIGHSLVQVAQRAELQNAQT